MQEAWAKLEEYAAALEQDFAQGVATEQTYRPALKSLIEGLAEGVTALNEPRRIQCGAPDFILLKGPVILGYIEAKDIDKNLDEIEEGHGPDGERFRRYLDSLSNVVLTDYLEFRWFVRGERRLKARLGVPTPEGKIRVDREGLPKTAELLTEFLSHQAEAVVASRELAHRMAQLTRLIRDMIIAAFEHEPASGSLHTQWLAFQENLIPELSVPDFADMYAQTIAYGLFAARCTNGNSGRFTRQNAAYLLPKTNPFLRRLFNHIAGPDLDDRIAWLVDDLVQVLAQADMAAVLEDFGKRNAKKEEPVVHFYETFLKEYDPQVREMRGVYYTPEPVVSYIVRSLDHLLKTEFDKPQGLADPTVLILDPAVGTGTFLYGVIQEIYQSLVRQGQRGLWDEYAAEKLLPRLFGFELLMAPYAVAHLKLGLLLQETGYHFQTDQRLGIYLTNTLDEAVKKSELLFAQFIVDEANAAARVKKELPIMIVLGNPPYSGHSANKGQWAKQLVQRYKTVDGQPLGEKNPKWLQDDYVKFIAFGQRRIEQTGQGVVAFITNHSYLDNPTFRGMRQSLMETFTDIYILNLHGNAKKKEVAPDGGKDENVFDIQQGVAICLLVKAPSPSRQPHPTARVHYADLWGPREDKSHWLLEHDLRSTRWTTFNPASPFYLFTPMRKKLSKEYEKGWKIPDIFPINSVGIVTARDHFVFDFARKTLEARISLFRGAHLSDQEVEYRFRLTNKKGWNIRDAREALRQDEDYHKGFVQCLYRPFDVRHLFYHKAVIERPRHEVMRHMLAGKNLALVAMRQVSLAESYTHILATRNIVDNRTFMSSRGITTLFPLYLYPTEEEKKKKAAKRRANLSPEFIQAVSEKWGLRFVEEGQGDLKKTFGPEDIFYYAYAVLHSPTYRSRYGEFLKIDFPRLPITSDRKLVRVLVEKGAELTATHLMEAPCLERFITKYPVAGSNRVEKVAYDPKKRRVHINPTQYFEGVPTEVWEFSLGGYQPAQKWLKDRKDRSLSYEELIQYQKIIAALHETLRLVREIDAAIPAWPLE